MKRLCLCLLVCLVYNGFAAEGRGAEGPRLRVATFSSDVTPPVGGQPLIWTTPVKTIEDPLLAKGIVLDDGKARYVLCAVDWCGLCNSSHRLFRTKLAVAVGTDAARVMVHTVHQHTAPYVDGDAQRLLDRTEKPIRYVDLKALEGFADRVGAAAKQSLDHFQDVDQIGMGQAKVDRVASSRRVITPGRQDPRPLQFGGKDPAMRALPEGFIDPYLKTITLARGDKPIVRIHYYATHPQSFYGDPRASSDVPGFARERLQKKENVFQMYFDGCGGDVTFGKYNDGTRAARDELTARLFAGMEAAVAATRYVPAGPLRWRSVPLVFPLPADIEKVLSRSKATLENPQLTDVARVTAATRVTFANRIKEPMDASVLGDRAGADSRLAGGVDGGVPAVCPVAAAEGVRRRGGLRRPGHRLHLHGSGLQGRGLRADRLPRGPAVGEGHEGGDPPAACGLTAGSPARRFEYNPGRGSRPAASGAVQ